MSQPDSWEKTNGANRILKTEQNLWSLGGSVQTKTQHQIISQCTIPCCEWDPCWTIKIPWYQLLHQSWGLSLEKSMKMNDNTCFLIVVLDTTSHFNCGSHEARRSKSWPAWQNFQTSILLGYIDNKSRSYLRSISSNFKNVCRENGKNSPDEGILGDLTTFLFLYRVWKQ